MAALCSEFRSMSETERFEFKFKFKYSGSRLARVVIISRRRRRTLIERTNERAATTGRHQQLNLGPRDHSANKECLGDRKLEASGGLASQSCATWATLVLPHFQRSIAVFTLYYFYPIIIIIMSALAHTVNKVALPSRSLGKRPYN